MTPEVPDSPWSDLDRPPLNGAALRRALVRPGTLWTRLDVVPSTGSTNSDLVARAGSLPAGTVLVAERQTAARGRLDRRWSAPARSGLFFSVLLRPEVPEARWTWLPLLAGVATATTLSRTAGVDTALKWPNDLLVTQSGGGTGTVPHGAEANGEARVAGGSEHVTERKIGGILAERAAADDTGREAVVIGVGLNVTLRADELPVPTAGSLALAGAPLTDRAPLLRAVLRSLAQWYEDWTAADGDPLGSGLQETYAAGCSTLGRTVRAELPGGRSLTGEAVALDGDGRLVLATADGVRHPVGAGDIVHLRPADAGPDRRSAAGE